MTISKVEIQRFSITTSKPFEQVVAALEAAIAHPDMSTFMRDAVTSQSYADLETFIQKAVGPSGLMQFARFDIGAIMRKESGTEKPRITRFLVGNPLILKKMAIHVPEAASYAPVTILVDERADGVHLSYDRMASLLASYGNTKALGVAKELDSKIETLMTEAAANR